MEAHAAFMDITFIRSYEEVVYEGRLASLMTQLHADAVVPEGVSLDLWCGLFTATLMCRPIVVAKYLCRFLVDGLDTTPHVYFMLRLYRSLCNVRAFIKTATMTDVLLRLPPGRKTHL